MSSRCGGRPLSGIRITILNFWRDIWPILTRPEAYQWVLDFDPFTGGDPHNTAAGAMGNFDPDLLAIPPHEGESSEKKEQRQSWRMRLYNIIRKPGQENHYTVAPDPDNPKYRPRAMPFLCGDNPISNTLPAKFLMLTDTQLFLLKQWAAGKFLNEKHEGFGAGEKARSEKTGIAIDRGTLANLLGGSFCPGAEAMWIMRNPAIYSEPYRIKHNPGYQPGSLSLTGNFAKGLEPGDVTQYSAVPWQSDFNECSTQNVDITYDEWNKIYPNSEGDPVKSIIANTFWWPSHRPMEVFTAEGGQVAWSEGIPGSNAGDLKMVTAWKELGFIKDNPKATPTNGLPSFIQVERNDDEL